MISQTAPHSRRRSGVGTHTSSRNTMTDLVPIPVALFERLARTGLDVDAILRRANLPRSRFNVAKPEGTTAEFFASGAPSSRAALTPALGYASAWKRLPIMRT